jgi:hypothetical protein
MTDRLNERGWQDFLGQVERWCKASPKSVTARIVLADAHLKYAHTARGSSLPMRSPPEGANPAAWKLYEARLEKAEKILEEVKKLPTKDPEMYHVMLKLGVMKPWSKDKFEAAFQEAFKFEPTYFPIYKIKAANLLPDRYGKPGDMEKFAAEIAHLTQKTQGDTLYARILAEQYWATRDDFFHVYPGTWQRMKRGFARLVRDWPDSVWLLNQFCRFACLAGDRETAEQLFERLGDNWNYYLWESEGSFLQWRRWANGEAKSPLEEKEKMPPEHEQRPIPPPLPPEISTIKPLSVCT